MEGTPSTRVSIPFLTRAAQRDIKSIWRYIALDSERHANLVQMAILETCSLAARLPDLGHKRPELSERNVLFLPVTSYSKYVVAYAPGTDPLRIVRILHGARDISRLF
jgi:plasmid stabilization system protein ParE